MKRFNVVLIFNKEFDSILMCHRTKMPYLGLYNLVGGKIEDGENPLAGAIREMEEETGISREEIVVQPLMEFVFPWQNIHMYSFVGKLDHDVELVEEAHPLLWMRLDEHNFFDLEKFAGEGNIGHMIEQVKMYFNEIFEGK